MALPTRDELKKGYDALRSRGYTDAEINKAASQTLTTVQQETEKYRPGFLERLQAGFATTPVGEANIYRGMGYEAFPEDDDVYIRTPTGRVRADPKGFDVGDIADVAGEVPAIAGGALAGLVGAGAGIWSGPGAVAAGAAAGAVGSGAGDWARQQIGQQFGSGEETDWGRVALEGALGAGGELGGRYVGKLLAGPFKRSRTAPDIAKTIDQVVKFDEQYGTELSKLAPADVQTGSEFLGQATQRVREGQFAGQRLRETQDIPFEREVEKGFEAIRGQAGLTQRAGESEAGKGLKEAVASTLKRRSEELGELYKEFEGLYDPSSLPDLSNTNEAIREIFGRKFMRRGETGKQGLSKLRKTLKEAQGLQTFDELVVLREAVGDVIDVWDPAKKSNAVQAAYKKLRGALKDDEYSFLEAGGRKSTRPQPIAAPMTTRQKELIVEGYRPTINIETKPAQAARAVGETLTPNQIVRGMGGLMPNEIKRIRGAMDADRGLAMAIGKLRGNPGMTIEEMLENVRGNEQGDSIFRAAGIESADDFMEAIRTKSFFEKFQAGAESFERGAAREQAEAARGQIGSLFEQIEEARSMGALEVVARQAEEARRSNIIEAEDFKVLRDEFEGKVAQILEIGDTGNLSSGLASIARQAKDENEFLTRTIFGNVNRDVLFKLLDDAPDGTEVGTLGDLFIGGELRKLYGQALDVPIVILKRPISGGRALTQAADQEFLGAQGRMLNKDAIFFNNTARANQKQPLDTIFEEAAHILRNRKGRSKSYEGADVVEGRMPHEEYRGTVEEVSADKMVKHAKSIIKKATDEAFKGGEKEEALRAFYRATQEPAADIPDIGLPSQAAREAGQRARSYSAEMHRIDKAQPLKTLFDDDYKLSEIPEKLSGMNKDQIRVAREAIGSKGAGAGLPSTEEGAAAWRNIVAEVFDDLKQKMRNPDKSTYATSGTPEHFVVSGDRLLTALSKYKPGALEEIFGPKLAGELLNFAEMAKGVNVSERTMNKSMTNVAQRNILNVFDAMHPLKSMAKMLGTAAAETGIGRLVGTEGGKRYLLGTSRLQAEHPTLLQLLGRAGAQTGVQGLQGSTGAR